MNLDLLRDALPTFAARDAASPTDYPAESVAGLYELGAIQAPFSSELGGSGATAADAVELVEALAGASGSLALIACMPLGLASIYALPRETIPESNQANWDVQVRFASQEYGRGHLYAACNSEKGAGGALSATKTVASRDPGGHFRLTGEKILATGGKHAAHFFSTAKVSPEDLPGTGVVEFFVVPTTGDGVKILDDWDGFGMQSTESQTVRYDSAAAESLLGFPNFIEVMQPLVYFHLLFAAVPLGCAGAMLRELTTPAPQSPALRLKFNEALMRYESLRAYLLESARAIHPASSPAFRARILRTKTFVSQEATKLAAELFALSGGRSYRRNGAVARAFRDSFAGTALRPPLPLALETLSESFSLEQPGV